MAEDKIEKIYDVSLLGVDDVLKGMDEVNASFDKAKSTFLSFKDAVKTSQGSARAEFEKSRVELLKQQTAQKNLRAETIAYNNALNAQKLAAKQATDSAKAVSGSYEDLRQRAKALREQLKSNFVIEGLDSKKVAEGTAELKKLVAQMQQFDRSLTKDGTLVGEYTSGINKSFASLKANLSQLVLGFIGFQAVIGGLKSAFDQTVQLDSLNKSMEVVSNSTNELSINQKFLIETSELLGIQLLESGVAFKNFYASSVQAGISAEETRKIFFAAASASANLKLSQENTNGVLLAFGQIASKGKVQAEELRGQIGERIPGAFAIAARAIGVTQVELNKMLQNGQVISSEFLPKFAAELQKTFGTTEKVEGLQASINRLKNSFTRLVQDNEAGLGKLINLLILLASTGFKFIKFLTSIPFAVVITGLSLASAAWAFYKGNVISASVAQAFNSRETLLGTVRHLAYRLGLIATTSATKAQTAATAQATAATEGLNLAVKSSPLGLLLAGIALIIPAMYAYGDAVDDTTEKLKKQREEEANLIEEQEIAAGRLTKLAKFKKASVDIKDGKFDFGVSQSEFITQNEDGTFQGPLSVGEVKPVVFPINISLLKKQIEDYNKQIDEFKGTQAGLNALILEREKIQKQLDNALGKADKSSKAAEKQVRKGQQKEEQQIQKEEQQIQKAQDDFQIKILQDAEAHRSKEIKELEIFFLKQRNIILNNTALTDKQRKAQLAALADAEKRTLLSAEVALLTEEVNEKEKLFRRDAKNEADYLEAQKKLLDKSNELANLKPSKNEKKFIVPGGGSTQSIIGKKISSTFGTEGQTGEDVLLGDIIAQSFNIANQAMNNYFDAEAARIQRSKEAKLSQLDTERDIALSRATTQAQEDKINRDFEAKKREAEKESFERMKDLKKKEAAITFATELINIAAAAAASGPYAPIQYAILAGLAGVRYGIQLNNINAQQFKRGGQIPLEGGEFIGPSHDGGGIPFSGAQFEAEGKEVAIINKKASQSNVRYTVTGTPKQIASSINTIGGGVRFAPGANMFKLANGGYLGSSLQPPVFASYYQNSTAGIISGGDNTEIKAMMKELISAVYRESFKPVVLNPGAVTEYQNDTARKVKIGQL